MKRAVLLLPVVLLFLIAVGLAETPGPGSELKLIPEPKEVQLHEGNFHVRATTRILVEFGHQSEDRIAAETLVEEIQDQSGLKLRITGENAQAKEERSTITLARLEDRSVKEFLESKGLKADSIGDQGYLLFADDSHLIVAANTGQGLFYGCRHCGNCCMSRVES